MNHRILAPCLLAAALAAAPAMAAKSHSPVFKDSAEKADGKSTATPVPPGPPPVPDAPLIVPVARTQHDAMLAERDGPVTSMTLRGMKFARPDSDCAADAAPSSGRVRRRSNASS